MPVESINATPDKFMTIFCADAFSSIRLSHFARAVYAAQLDGGTDYDEPDYTEPSAFLIGNEGNGLRRETAERASQYIRIPMAGQVESLNAAAAATILMYEAARQHRRKTLKKVK